jgi:iron complex outermembrane receptor protein
VSLSSIDRIEVISGPGASVWGANAVNGVINITTRRAGESQGGRVQVGGGSGPDAAAEARYGGSIDSTLHFRVYGQSFQRPASYLPNGDEAGDDWRTTQAGVRADWDRAASTLTLQSDLYSGRIDQLAGPRTTISGGNALGRWTLERSPTSNVVVQVYYDRTRRVSPGAFEETLDTYDVDLQHRFALGTRNDIVWGLGYRLTRDTVTNSIAIAFLPAALTAQLFTGFVQNDITLVPDRLHLAIGAKIEHNHYTGVEIEPSIRAAWRVRPRQTVWAAVSRAVRAPSRIDREFHVPGQEPFVINGGPNVQSETAMAYELGYRAQPTASLSFSLSTYVNSWDDLRSVQLVSTAPLELRFANNYHGVSAGAELAADYRVTGGWRLHAGYTQLDVNIDPRPGTNALQLDNAEIFDAKSHFSLRSSVDLPASVTLHADYRHVSRVANHGVPAYSELDARLAWRFTRVFEVSVTGRNLLNETHAEFGAPAARRLVGRRVFGQLEWRF